MNQHNTPIYTVSELNQLAKALLENTFPDILVSGEISNFSCPRSGHWYFTLKDANAQIRCAMFKHANQYCRFMPEDGISVVAKGRLSLYGPRGDYQFIVTSLEEAGIGTLRRAFEQLKQKLAVEGLFDEMHKQPLPQWPQCLGVITSPTGAAVRDIINVLKRRFPALPVIIYPVPVQGKEATPLIAEMIAQADRDTRTDLLIVARGGGSLEDLWCFNEEAVARAIYHCQTPIISAIGHQTDFTIADFVADVRAPTPSAAAELASPDQAQILALFQGYEQQLIKAMDALLRHLTKDLTLLRARLKHPERLLEELFQRFDHLETRLTHQIQLRIQQQEWRLNTVCARLHAVSPLATLERGYSITCTQDRQIIKDARQVETGMEVINQLAYGELVCSVKQVCKPRA